uniref:Uncharacterized protein n=1 Tax=Pundamilia nyererei TaxID=303518 RepID=A0A3B4H093_9CICH
RTAFWGLLPHSLPGQTVTHGPMRIMSRKARQYLQLTEKQKFESELIIGVMWFWILWHCWLGMGIENRFLLRTGSHCFNSLELFATFTNDSLIDSSRPE